jgi:hypothetical protein
MIKKNTTIIIDGSEKKLKGGMPFSKGEIINIKGKSYEVSEKKIDYSDEGEDQIVNITYNLNKK